MSELFIEGGSDIESAHEASRLNCEPRRINPLTDADVERLMSKNFKKPVEKSDLSKETVEKMVGTLLYLKREFDAGFRIDAVNMMHVNRVLTCVQIERAAAAENARNNS